MAEAALPTKLVEALAAGRPIIVSADGEAADIVRRASAGIATPAEDSLGLAEAILQLTADPAARSRMGKHARDAAVTRFDRRIVVGRLADILTDAVASEAPRHAG
jgi:glycosyltransferase involved in cell wall biosynthesis